MRMGAIVLALVGFLAVAEPAGAQDEVVGSVAEAQGVVVGEVVEAQDAGVVDPDAEADPVPERPNGARVLIASAAYPGLGQFLNGSERKAAIIGGTEMVLLAQLLLEDRWTRNALRHYRETGDIDYFDEYSTHYDRRQSLIWWAAIVALYSIVDAYVDAHLSGFEEGVPTGFGAAVAAAPDEDGGFRVGLEVRF
ncbi:hypothetical protein K8S17_00780 [bacterium]|nr:hypothetical protein [bacterium]